MNIEKKLKYLDINISTKIFDIKRELEQREKGYYELSENTCKVMEALINKRMQDKGNNNIDNIEQILKNKQYIKNQYTPYTTSELIKILDILEEIYNIFED
ncbi:MAG: hypothetical protein PHE29_13460 [Tissierellia bacterium]|nr:hypothetical protein [Tissierellia bacterium]MDD4779225.1 hypothetical protein [Tissierellia bacterium]